MYHNFAFSARFPDLGVSEKMAAGIKTYSFLFYPIG
jgi:hypothetical protein